MSSANKPYREAPMLKGKLVFAQLNEHLPKPIFRDCVKRYAGRYQCASPLTGNRIALTEVDRYQTTVPETVRRALRLNKRDKIQYLIRPNGEVVLTRANEMDADDPVLGQFLGFLANDISAHPELLQAIDPVFVQRIQFLVSGALVDLDAPLSKDDE